MVGHCHLTRERLQVQILGHKGVWQMAASGLLAWWEVQFALRNRVTNPPVPSEKFSFLALKWLETPCQEQARLRQIGTTNCLFQRCYRHVDWWLPMAPMIPLESLVPFTSFTTHPSRGCTAATGPHQRPARVRGLPIKCGMPLSIHSNWCANFFLSFNSPIKLKLTICIVHHFHFSFTV